MSTSAVVSGSIFGKTIKHGSPKDIIIGEERQRSGGAAINTEDLEPSIRARGIMNPIIVKKTSSGIELVAGERRLRAALKVGLISVPYRFVEELDEIELQLVELEENERRKDLEWKDHVKAIAKIHSLYELKAAQAGEPWSIQRTADMLFYAQGHISKILRIAKDLGSPKIANAPGLNAAYNILAKVDERGVADAMNSLLDAGRAAPAQSTAKITLDAIIPAGESKAVAVTAPAAVPPLARPAFPESILNESFLEWAPTYAGPRFNFIHCDFPYGANLFNGPQSGRDSLEGETYDDDPDVFWQLLRCFLKHRDNFLSPSAHVMFWFDMDYYADILALCAELAPEIMIRRKPLIWVKTCNSGILSDPKRGPRHIYETCLIMSREDRFIVKATSDSYGCHIDKEWHPSTKPEAMLRYFMGMFVDEHTQMLDPTCGGGSALRAAESLGASKVLGLEINKEFFANAQTALRQFRTKAALSKKGAGK